MAKQLKKLEKKQMRLFLTDKDDGMGDIPKKCSGCGWAAKRFYGLGTTLENARSDFLETVEIGFNGLGLCGECMAELLEEEKYKIVAVES
jgi:hypothetical protein